MFVGHYGPSFAFKAPDARIPLWLLFIAVQLVDIAWAVRYGMIAFGMVMLALQASVFFGPPPASAQQLALTALFSYLAFAAAAYWLERKRVPTRAERAP